MKSEDELQVIFTTQLESLLEPLEQYRLKKVRKIRNYLYGAIASILLILIGIFSQQPILIFVLCLPMFYFFGFALQTFLKMADSLRKQFKLKILPELLSSIFDHYEYIPNQKIAKTTLEKSMIFPDKVAFAMGEDFMRFRIGETKIMFCEAQAFAFQQNKLFQGIFIAATFNKEFTSKTIVFPRWSIGFLQRIKRKIFDGLKIVKLEDIEFNKEFIVLGNDQVGARYILTPGLMQRILDYKRKTKKGISFSFIENRLYCAIPNYLDLFEPALFEPFNFDFIKKTFIPLNLYTDLVDDLNLNLKIWN
jgi:hypothetical protein